MSNWTSGPGVTNYRRNPGDYRWFVESAVDEEDCTHWAHPESESEQVHALCDIQFRPVQVCWQAPADHRVLCAECLSRMYRVLVRYVGLDGIN